VVARIEHVPSGNIFDAFQRFHNEVLARLDAKPAIADQSPTAQLALPNDEAGSHC
jgi:hypothetical protein